ncbi:hypothetical protein ABKV19_006872 [Rosa sericea]
MRVSNTIGACKSLSAFLIAADLQSVNRRDKFCSRISAKTDQKAQAERFRQLQGEGHYNQRPRNTYRYYPALTPDEFGLKGRESSEFAGFIFNSRRLQPYQAFGCSSTLEGRPPCCRLSHKTNDQLQSSLEDNDVLEHAIDKKNELVYCKAKIPKFVPKERRFYLACPKCFKEMRKKPQSELLICADHDMQQPLYWFAEPPPALYLPFCLCSTASYLVDTERDRPKDTGGKRERKRGPPFKREDKKKKQQRVVRLASTQNFEDEGEDNVDWEEAPVAGFFPYSFDKELGASLSCHKSVLVM